MLLSRLAATTTVAAALVTVTACTHSSNTSSRGPSTGGSSTVTPTASTAVAATSADPSFVNGGAALANRTHLIFVLEAVNPEIGTDESGLIAKSKTLCSHINANESESQLETTASRVFTNGSWVPAQLEAQAIVGTVKAYGNC